MSDPLEKCRLIADDPYNRPPNPRPGNDKTNTVAAEDFAPALTDPWTNEPIVVQRRYDPPDRSEPE